MTQVYADVVVSGLLIGCVYALIATGLTLVFGVMRMVNIAHGEMVVIGMYTGYWCHALLGWGSLPAAFLAALLLFCIGYVVQRLVVNRLLAAPIQIQFLLYIGLALVITGLHTILFGPNGRGIFSPDSFASYDIFGMRLDRNKSDAAIAALLLMGTLVAFLRYTVTGKSIRGCAENLTGAEIVGIRIDHVFAITAGIGTACAGAAGALIAPLFDTHPFLGEEFTLLAFVIVTVGGLGSFLGAFVGGLIIGVTEGLAALMVEPAVKSLFSYGLLILVLLVRPYGILGKKGVA